MSGWGHFVASAVILTIGWLAVAVPDFGSGEFYVDTLVFISLGAYAIGAATTSHRSALKTERKLRLGLLVHNMELEKVATRDHLTQVFTRRHFMDRLSREFDSAKGFKRRVAVIVLDVSHLQAVNAEHGHSAGDALLARFGRFLLDQARASDIPARLGGNEFAILLPDTTEQAAQQTAKRLAQALEKQEADDREPVRLTTAMGVAGYPWAGESVDEILVRAESAMLEQKRQHKSANGTPANGAKAGAAASEDAPAP